MASDCPRPATRKERRAYDEKLKALGGPRSDAGKAFIEDEHRRFKEAKAAHNAEAGFLHWVWHG